MATISDLVVKITAKTAEFKKNIGAARQSMNKFADMARKRAESVSEGLRRIGSAAGAVAKALAAATAVGAGFVGALAVRAGTIKEWQTLSNTLGVSVSNLQRWQFAGRSVGIEADKMGDIFKDTSDKLGDFLATGGGEAADLFEKLNLDAKEFIGLAPDKALLKIGRAIEPLTQEQKVFFLEAIADDASRLIPLLDNNAAGFRRLAAEAERTGNVLDERGVAAAVRFREAWNGLINRGRGFITQLTGALAPALDTILTRFGQWIDSQGGVANAARSMANVIINGIEGAIKGVASFIRSIGGIEVGFLKIRKSIIDVIGVLAQMSTYLTPSVWAQKFGINFADSVNQNLRNAMAEESARLAGQINDAAARFNIDDFEKETNRLLGEIRGNINKPITDNNKSLTDNTKAIDKLREQFSQQNEPGKKAWEKVFGKTDESDQPVEKKISAAFIAGARRLQTQIAMGLTARAAATAEELQRRIDQTIARPGGSSNLNTGFSTGRLAETDVEGMQMVLDRLLGKMDKQPQNIGTLKVNLNMGGQEIMTEITGDPRSLQEFAQQVERVTEDRRRAATR